MTQELASLLDELGIKAIPCQRYRGPMMTSAIASMERILHQHGYAHLKIVLMSIAETANNGRELAAPVIWAVSDLILAHPTWTKMASDWFAVLDRIKLGDLWLLARMNRRAVQPRAGIAAMLFFQMNPIFGELRGSK